MKDKRQTSDCGTTEERRHLRGGEGGEEIVGIVRVESRLVRTRKTGIAFIFTYFIFYVSYD